MHPRTFHKRKFGRILLGLQAWRQVKQSRLFDDETYLKLNPGLIPLPWYLSPSLHWVLFGRGLDDLRPTSSHLTNAKLAIIADGPGEISESDKAVLQALDLNNVEAVKAKLSSASSSCAIAAAHWIACKKMEIGPARSVTDKLNENNYHPKSPKEARRWLDLARASGSRTDISFRALTKFLPSMQPQGRVFEARLPAAKDFILDNKHKSQIASLTATLNSDYPFLKKMFEAATQNEAGQKKYFVAKHNDKICRIQDEDVSEQRSILRVRIPMPIYWAEPQRSHSVLGPVTLLLGRIYSLLLDQDRILLPVWATPIFDISAEADFGYPTLSYHTICSADQSVEGDVHFKESYLPGWFSQDHLGYSGWSTLAQSPAKLRENPIGDAEFVANLRRDYLDKNLSKYEQFSKPAPPAGYIFAVLQVPDDTVATLAHMPTAVWVATLLKTAKGHRVVFKRHPKDTTPETDALLKNLSKFDNFLLSDAPIRDLIKGATLVVTANSGVGFESLLGEKPVITCGRSDYSAATVEAKSTGVLSEAIKHALNGNHPVSISTSNAFVRYYLERTCFTLSDYTVLERALGLNQT